MSWERYKLSRPYVSAPYYNKGYIITSEHLNEVFATMRGRVKLEAVSYM